MPAATDSRPDPDALLAAALREGRGRLKVFLGAAPGVGKTWEMLSQARRRRAEGVDVVGGVIETHGRAETEAQLADLPLLPLKDVPYRGQVLREFDLDAALARRPGLLLVDELAHTNAPGSRHAKRWEDVADLVAAGLTVWATLNVQHLESLNDDVARITGIRVTETLPDHVLEGADEVELIDLPPAALRTRLQEGRIYRPDNARRALDGYFREGNLAALREIALRRTAAHVDDDVREWMQQNRVAGPWPAGDRILALIGPDAGGEAVIRTAKRLADALHAPWLALHVERPTAAPRGRPSLLLAAQLGAEIETRSGDLVAAALDVARARNVTQIVVGRPARPATVLPHRWRHPFRPALGVALLRAAPSYALHVVPSGAPPRTRPVAVPDRMDWRAWAAATVLVAAVTGAGRAADGLVPPEAMGMLFLAAVVAAATLQGVRLALYTAVVAFGAWDFFFIPPVGAISIANTHDAVALAVFLLVAGITGGLASRVRAEARAGQARIASLRRIGQFSRRLGQFATEPELLAEIVRQAAAAAGEAAAASILVPRDDELHEAAAHPADTTLDEGSLAAARWAAAHAVETGAGTATLPAAPWRFLPVRTTRGTAGVLGLRTPAPLDGPVLQAVESLVDQAALALERLRLGEAAARTAAMADTQKLRTALLNSLSHDLRTPLTGIRGAAGTLRGAWDQLPPGTRADLLASIEEDTARMTRFLANIMDLTRLESGQVSPRLEAVDTAEAVEAAIARVPGAAHFAVSTPAAPPPVLADAALLEQVLVNLLENAVKYAPAGSHAAVRVTEDAGTVRIAVADEGVGIAAADLPHVFDSFRRATRGDAVAPGTGLGLAIARGLVEAMGGRIDAVSPRPDVPRDASPGTVVTLQLPRAPEHPP